MNQPTLILSKLAERFPGLVDGDQEVNGGDVVSFLSQYQDELAAIAEKGAQTGRRRTLPKHQYNVMGESKWSDLYFVTDAHVAAAKFLKKRKVLPKVVLHGDQTEIVAGQCALSGAVLFESDDYLYLRRDVQVDAQIDGEPVGVVPDLQKVLRSAMMTTSFPDEPDVKWYERAEVEGPVPVGQERLSGILTFLDGKSVTFDRATPQEVNEVTSSPSWSSVDMLRAKEIRASGKRYASVYDMIRGECGDEADKILEEIFWQGNTLRDYALLFVHSQFPNLAPFIVGDLKTAMDAVEQVESYWDNLRAGELAQIEGVADEFSCVQMDGKFEQLDEERSLLAIKLFRNAGLIP